jgi:hypothetical protein
MMKRWLTMFLALMLLTALGAGSAGAAEVEAFVRGQVLRPGGEPAADAAVHVCTVEEILYGSTGEETSPCLIDDPVTTDAEGRFVLGPLWPDWYEVRAVLPGFVDGVDTRVRAAAGDANKLLKLRLRHGTVVTGRVIDEAGAPVAGAEVEGWTQAGRAWTVTENDGSFRIEGMGAGRGSVRAEAPGYWGGSTFLEVGDAEEPVQLEWAVSMRVREPEEAPVESVATEDWSAIPEDPEPPGDITVTGIFRDLAPGEVPLVYLSQGGAPWRASVELDGHWWVSELTPGTWTVHATLGRGMNSPDFSKTIEIPPGATELHLELRFADGLEAP